MNTDCSKCGASEPSHKVSGNSRMAAFFNAAFVTTGFMCQKCGHWNNFKRRKGFVEYMADKCIKR